MIEKIRYEKLFATPLIRYQVDDYEALNADILVECERLRSKQTGVNKSNLGGWHSKGNLFDNTADCIKQLEIAAKDAVFDITRKSTKKVDPEELRLRLFAWINVNQKGCYNAPHTHPMAHWSGVYYVHQPEKESGRSGMLEFLDPRTDLPNWRILGGASFRPRRRIRPSTGELVLFPSYLMHWVYPNESDSERVSIAFNATFRKAKKSNI